MIDVAIRFDDPSATSDHALERELVAEQESSATFAVIPCADRLPLRAEQMAHLIEAQRCGTVEIAQHGYSHESCIGGSDTPSEFAGVDPAEQARRIADGKTILGRVFGVTIGGFVPPFNSFDQATVRALEQQGFHYLSAGRGHDLPDITHLSLVPRICQAFELRGAIQEAHRRVAAAPSIVAVMHHYDFREHGRADARMTLHEFAALLEWIRLRPGVRLVTLGVLASLHDAHTWRAAVQRGRQAQQLHWRLRPFLPQHCLMTRPLWRHLRFPERLIA
ncbi:MAG: DUF2334 domain-containing protein [Gallionella sp.]|nr:DUF2334 domain-containing protein [Gallionella sp.]